ncbi:UNVERIFIED_CONTAM: hypothetical protein GTU68_019201 [Idotea baltica]|nr:hypothetical protein [Idotea baltica]
METQSLSNAMSDAENLKLFLAIHSYGQYMVYPWSYGYDFPPVNQKFVATRYTFAVEAVNNYHYTPINAADWYPAAGTTDDWALGVLGVNIALTLEVRDEGKYGFVLPASQIAPTRAENWEGFKYLISHAKSV